jgi:phage tail-like protein
MTEITAYDDYNSNNNYESDSEFKYLVIGSLGKWKQGTIQEHLVFEENLPTGGISLQRFSEFARSAEYRIPVDNPIDLALDTSCDIFFILDGDSKRLLLYDLNANYWEWIKCIRFTDPRAIAVGSEDLFVLDGNSIFVLAKSNFQVKRIVENIGVDPRAIALDNHRGHHHLYVYDADITQKQLYLVSYLTGRVTPLFKHGERRYIGEVSAISIGKHDNNKLYLLDYGKRQVRIFSLEKDPIRLEIVIPCGTPPQAVVSGVAAIDNESIFVGDKAKGVQYYYPHPRKYTASSSSSSPPQPLDYSRQTHKIILNDKADVLYAINLTDNWIIKFVMEERFASNGNYISTVIDSGINALQWHKYVLECAIPDPENSSIEISYFASDTEEMPAEGQWIKTDLPNPSDALMFEARGRYLRFKIQLSTTKNNNNNNHRLRSTPVIWRIRAYLPRLSYLRYLPVVYQEDRRSREFLERFLSLFETFFNQIDELSFTKYIDPKSTSDEFLPWLASWLALAYDENWPKENFRKLLEKAPYLYKMRGTRRGLEETIAIFLDSSSSNSETKRKKIECPEDPSSDSIDKEEMDQQASTLWDSKYKFMIYESFQINRKDISEDYKRLFCTDPYTFCVLLNPRYVDANKYKIIKKIVQDQKPAHTVGNTVLLQPWFYLGMHTYLGINTVLQEPRFVVGKSTVGRDTQVTSPNNSGQINIQARLGVDTRLS